MLSTYDIIIDSEMWIEQSKANLKKLHGPGYEGLRGTHLKKVRAAIEQIKSENEEVDDYNKKNNLRGDDERQKNLNLPVLKGYLSFLEGMPEKKGGGRRKTKRRKSSKRKRSKRKSRKRKSRRRR